MCNIICRCNWERFMFSQVLVSTRLIRGLAADPEPEKSWGNDPCQKPWKRFVRKGRAEDLHMTHWVPGNTFHQISNIRRTKSLNLNVSRLVLQLSLSNLLKPCVKLRMRCSWSSTDRRCSNYIWLIKNLIAHKGTSYIRDLTVTWVDLAYGKMACCCGTKNLEQLFEITFYCSYVIIYKWSHFIQNYPKKWKQLCRALSRYYWFLWV